jgi:hypothetical protein
VLRIEGKQPQGVTTFWNHLRFPDGCIALGPVDHPTGQERADLQPVGTLPSVSVPTAEV